MLSEDLEPHLIFVLLGANIKELIMMRGKTRRLQVFHQKISLTMNYLAQCWCMSLSASS